MAQAVITEIKINPAEHAVALTTTLNLLKKAGACASGYAKLLDGLGGPSFDHDKPINLLTILATNGLDDCLWALCATGQNSDKVVRLIAADFAGVSLAIYEKYYPNDPRPRNAINAARGFALGQIGDAARAAARDAARAAARDAAWDAAWAAARAAARAAAWAAARAAAKDAAWDAAGAAEGDAAWAAAGAAARAAARAAQTDILKSYLLP